MARLHQLDGLRAIAVTLVILTHSTSGLTSWFGPFGVRLFYVLSGFLITSILLSTPDPKAFYIRRCLRIFPLYYFAIIVYWLAGVEEMNWLWPWLVTYTSNFTPLFDYRSPGPLGHFWSLAVEEQFYLLWPWLIIYTKRQYLPQLIVALILLAPITRAIATFYDLHALTAQMPACLDALGLGALLAYIKTRHTRPITTIIVGIAVLFLGLLLVPSARFYFIIEPMAEAFIALALVERATHQFQTPWDRLLATQPMVFLGTISYGIYVWHGLAWYVSRIERGLACFIVMAALSTCFATITWLLFERRLNDLRRYFPYRPARRTDPGGVEAISRRLSEPTPPVKISK